MRDERGGTLVELVAVLAILAVGIGLVTPSLGSALAALRAHGATADLYGAVHLTKSYARATSRTHGLVLEPDGRAFRIVEVASGQTVLGPSPLADGAVATSNVTIRFSSRGFAVPSGTITVRSEDETRRLIVNILGRVRVVRG
jgi:general secretion pathway protein H